jgi:dihydrofolate reductase
MNANRSTVTLHVVCSLDGFIARKDNTVSWLDTPRDVYEKGIAEGGGEDPVPPIDCFVLGSLTYEHALQLGWPYGDTPTVVLSSRKLASTRTSVEFHSGDLKKLMDDVLAPRFRNIWLVGGAIAGQAFLGLNLVDEIRLTIAPVLLGSGLRLFSDSGTESKWRLKDMVAYRNGFVAVVYGRPSAEA